jgi:hypothetical protein
MIQNVEKFVVLKLSLRWLEAKWTVPRGAGGGDSAQ